MEPLLIAKREAAKVLGISVRTLETLISLRQIKSVRVGRRRLIPTAELARFTRQDHVTSSCERTIPGRQRNETQELEA